MKKIISFVFIFSIILSALAGISILNNKAQAQNIGSLQSIVPFGFSFKKDLRIGDTDPDIIQLQKVLNADVATRIITDGPGALGKETSYFGELTKAAVIKFQNKYKNIVLSLNSITVADGVVNKATRTRLNLLIGVIDTYDSVGQPQSRAGSTSSVTANTYVAPTTIITQSQPQMSTCQFVELLINIGVIAPNKVSAARSVFSCSAVTSTAFVDIKVDGKDGPLTLSLPKRVKVSWTSSGVTSCQSGNSINKPVIGSETISVTTNGVFKMTCMGPTGSVSDSVIVEDIGNEEESNLIVSATVQASTTTATFFVTTNKLATHKIYYGTTVDTVSNVTISGRNTQSTKQITSLLPNTNYYFKVSATDSDDNIVESKVGTFTTLAVATTTISSTTVDIYVNGQKGIVNVIGELFTVSWSAIADYCIASSNPNIPQWIGWKESSGSTQVSLSSANTSSLYSSIGGGGTSVYSKEGVLLEVGSSKGPSNGYADTVRFTKAGGEYPDGSYAALGDGRKCSISETSNRVTTCISPNSSTASSTAEGIVFNLSCYRFTPPVVGTSSVSVVVATSTGSNTGSCSLIDYNTGSSCPSGWVNCDSYSHCGTPGKDCSVCASSGGGSGGRFLWKPKSDNDSKLVVLYGEGPDEPENQFGGVITRVTKCADKQCSEVVVANPCGGGTSVVAMIYGKDADGVPKLEKTLSGEIKLSFKDGAVLPKVGDYILGSALLDESKICRELENNITPSPAEFVGVPTVYEIGDKADLAPSCSNSTAIGDTGMGIGASIVTGAAIGAAVGSVVPGVGTGVGAIVGGVVGGISSLF